MEDKNSTRQPSYEHYEIVQYEEEISLLDLWAILWKDKWVVVGITTFFAVSAVIISLMLSNIYRAEALLAPAPGGDAGNSLDRFSGQLGGLASLAGINIGSQQVDKTTLAIEILKSRAFIKQFIHRHDLSVPLMAASAWDMERRQWIIDESLYDIDRKTWVRDVDPPKTPEPSDLEMYEHFKDRVLSVSRSMDTGLVTVAVSLKSPVVAQEWAELLIRDLNNHLRENDVRDAKRNIAYLEDQLKRTAVAEMQSIFYQLIEQQTKTMMLADARDEYVFKTIDPPVVPEKKLKPQRALICIVTTIVGGILGTGFVFIRYALRAAQSARRENAQLRT